MKKLRYLSEAARFSGIELTGADPFLDQLVMNLCWQGDFGKGIDTGSGIWSDPGANPCLLYGPATAAGVSNQGVPLPNWKPGMTVNGDGGSEFIYCKLVIASANTDLLPGQGYFWDKDFTATLMSGTNASNILNAEVGVLNVWSPLTAAGTYYIWLQRAGHCSVQAAGSSAATGSAETTGTAGQFKFPTSPTASQKNALPFTAYNASSSITFTGNTVNGSPYITNVVSVSGGAANPLDDIQLGQVITGTNLPSNAIIAAIDRQGSGWRITIGTNTAGSYATIQNCTGTANGTTFTVTSHVTANVFWPTFVKQN
jgi:hypothetical protein